MKRAFVTGVTGQDGSYLAELLLAKGYKVFGGFRRASTDTTEERLKNVRDKINLLQFDLTDYSSMLEVLKEAQPDEIYNLAAQSHVGTSFKQPHATWESAGYGVHRLLRAMGKEVPNAKFYQASTSELFGNSSAKAITEQTPFDPQSPYADAKLFAHRKVQQLRTEKGLFGSCGILFNHESPRRGLNFVTRKITHHIAKIKLGLVPHIELGNLAAKRDWGFAKEYVEAMWLMMQQEKPGDYVIGTGETHSVKQFVDAAFRAVDIPDWEAKQLVKVNPKFFRPAEVNVLLADASKAKADFGWEPRVKFDELVKLMVEADLQILRSQKL